MNLVISGPIDDNLRNTLVALVKPRNVVRLHARAYRLESADAASDAREAVDLDMHDEIDGFAPIGG